MALSGTLETFALPDVLHLLGSTGKTGVLTLGGDRGMGQVWLDEGQIIAASSDNAGDGSVDEVVADLLRFEEGSFEFDPTGVPEVADEPQTVGDVILAAETLLDEWRRIETVIPSLSTRVRLKRSVEAEVTVTPEHWDVLARIGHSSSVETLARAAHTRDLEMCRTLVDMLDAGLVEVDDTDPRTAELEAKRVGPAFAPPSFAANTIGSPDWTPPAVLGPDAIRISEWAGDPSPGEESDEPAVETDDVVGGWQTDEDLAAEGYGDDEPATAESSWDEEHDLESAWDDTGAADRADEVFAEAGDEPEVFAETDDVGPSADAAEFLSELSSLSPKAAAAIEALEQRGSEPEPEPVDPFLASLIPADADDVMTPSLSTTAPEDEDAPFDVAAEPSVDERFDEADEADEADEVEVAEDAEDESDPASGNLLNRFLSTRQ